MQVSADPYLNEDPTLPAPVTTDVGLMLYRRLADFEARGEYYDIDEVIVGVMKDYAARADRERLAARLCCMADIM